MLEGRLPENVSLKLDALPTSSGVYVFLDRAGEVLYVGKARSLRARVRSYFQPGSSDTRHFIARLPFEIGDLETIVVANEKEAALLENQLIKERKPRYNFKLRDDKDFLSIRLDTTERWPKLRVVRRPKADGAQYYGPYDSATAARRTLRVVNRHFKLRTCRERDFATRVRPCLQHQIKRCPAPCVVDVDRQEYLGQAKLVGLFLEGRHEEVVEDLEARMKEASARLAYEHAASYRDQLRAVSSAREEQRIASVRDVDQDALGLYVRGDRAELAMVLLRDGRMTSVRTYDLGAVTLPDDEIIASFLSGYYQLDAEGPVGGAAPDEILVPVAFEAMEGFAQVLSERRGKKVKILSPQRGPRVKLVAMARENAEHAFREKQREKEDVEARLGEIQKRLRLPRLPWRIECVDISHTGGTDTVAAVTALEGGEPDRKRYKSFHVRGVAGGDDYGAMREVLTRRLGRGRAAERGWELPDLLVVDGGRGQMGVAMAVLEDLGITDLPLCALAKEKANAAGAVAPERVFLPGQKNAIVLRERSAPRFILGMVRDEAHRVSNELRKKLARRTRLRSALDDVPGVGVKTKTALLRRLGSLKAIAAADEATLMAAGASQKQALALREALASYAPAEAGELQDPSSARAETESETVSVSESESGSESVSETESEIETETETETESVSVSESESESESETEAETEAETETVDRVVLDAESAAADNAFDGLEEEEG